MLVLDWMKTKVITVSPSASLLDCRRLYKEYSITRLPVVDGRNKVIGIISNTDLQAFLPRQATGLEILDALELLGERKVESLMVKNPVTIDPLHTVEQAAQLMAIKRVASLPVVDKSGELKGMITGWDIFRALLSISGALQSGEELGFIIPFTPGTLRELLDILKEFNLGIVSVSSTVQKDNMRQVKIRYRLREDTPDSFTVAALVARFKKHGGLRYWTQNGEVVLVGEPHSLAKDFIANGDLPHQRPE